MNPAMRLADLYPNKPELTGPKIDYYPHAEATRPSNETTIYDLITAIRGEDFAAPVAAIRDLIANGDKDAANGLKKKLPAVSISGTVDGRRAKAAQEGRFQHSGLLQIDLDAKDNIGWTVDEMREVLIADPRMVAVFVSASGEGVKGIARIGTDTDKHKAAFLAAEAHFKALKLTIDGACKDPVRLCFVSHDPFAWLRMDTDEMFEPVELAVVVDLDDEEQEEGGMPDIPNGKPQTPNHTISQNGGLVIRGGFMQRDLTPATVREMLAYIPSRPDYPEWLKIASAVWDAIGETEGTAALLEWSPEETEGEYSSKFQKRLTDVHAATLVMRAKEHGWAPPAPVSAPVAAAKGKTLSEIANEKNVIPSHVFPVPAGEIGHDLAARHIFSVIAPSNRLFMRGTTVHEVACDADGAFSLLPVPSKRFASMIETFGAKVMRRELREKGDGHRWRSTVFPQSSADIALSSDGAREMLPTIRQLVSAPVLIPDGNGETTVIGKGYHPHAGGTFVTNGTTPPIVPLADAIDLLKDALADFDFADGGDASRALASLISPAMKIGGWIDDDFPLDIAEADQSQSGKSYRFKLICAIYRESPSAITQAAGGVGSLDERVSNALINGRPFISFDNFRGRMDSQILETAIRGLGKVSARALRTAADIDCTPFLWQLSTNGAELTRDLANRSIVTRIRKRPDDHAWATFPEGDVCAHVRANQPLFLGAVHAVIREWVRQGCQRTNESRHDFRLWCRTMDWIVQEIFGFAPLLDGHREQQLRTANPRLQWLRNVINSIIKDGYRGDALTASDLGEAAEENDFPLPGSKSSGEAIDMRVGRVLGRLFKEAGCDIIDVDGIRFSRVKDHEYDPVRKEHRERKHYVIEGLNFATEDQQDDQQPELL
jgi:hypothetical protein